MYTNRQLAIGILIQIQQNTCVCVLDGFLIRIENKKKEKKRKERERWMDIPVQFKFESEPASFVCSALMLDPRPPPPQSIFIRFCAQIPCSSFYSTIPKFSIKNWAFWQFDIASIARSEHISSQFFFLVTKILVQTSNTHTHTIRAMCDEYKV